MPSLVDSGPACRAGCGACCIAPSISTPIPLGNGHTLAHKPAGQACPQLDAQRRCRLFRQTDRPAVCKSLQPSAEMCGSSAAHAMRLLARLERQTRPA